MVQKVLFSGQFFEAEVLMDLNVLKSPEFENHIFSGQSEYVFGCFCVLLLLSTIKYIYIFGMLKNI